MRGTLRAVGLNELLGVSYCDYFSTFSNLSTNSSNVIPIA